MTSKTVQPPNSRRLAIFAVAGVSVILVAAYVMAELGLGWIGAILTAMLMAAFAVPMFRAIERRAIATGNFSTAMKRYNRRMMAASLAYVVGLFGAIYAHDNFALDTVSAFAIALAPSVGVLWMVWSMARLIAEEEDEYLRHRYVRSALFGLGTLLTLATVWGFFEQFDLVPHLPTWTAVPVFAIGLGIASCTRWGQK